MKAPASVDARVVVILTWTAPDPAGDVHVMMLGSMKRTSVATADPKNTPKRFGKTADRLIQHRTGILAVDDRKGAQPVIGALAQSRWPPGDTDATLDEAGGVGIAHRHLRRR